MKDKKRFGSEDPARTGVATSERSEGARSDADRGHGFGIKARLLLALSCLAALTAIAGVTAFYVFGDIDRAVTRVTGESLPAVVTALGLAEKSSEIAISAPALLASRNQEERIAEYAGLSQKTRALTSLLQTLESDRVAPEATARLFDLRDELVERLEELNAVVENRLKLKAQRESLAGKLGGAHVAFLNETEPMVDDAYFDLVISGERVTAESTEAITRLVDGGVTNFDRLLTIRAEANLAAGLLAEAIHVDAAESLQPVRERFRAAAAAIERNVRRLPVRTRPSQLHQASAAILDLGRDEPDLFALRTAELKTGADGQTAAERDRRLARLKAAHDSLELVLIPLIDDLAFELVLTTERITQKSRAALTRLIDVGAQSLHVLLTVRSEGNLAAGILNRAAVTTDLRRLQPLRERFQAAEGRVSRVLGDLPPSVEAGRLQGAVNALLDAGRGADGLFALRAEELLEAARAESELNLSRQVTQQLGDTVANLVSATRADSQAAAALSAEAIGGGKLVIILLTAASMAGAGAVMAFYVGPRIVRPIEDITRAMSDLAAGNTSVDIPGRNRRDELGRMAKALGVFRDTAIEMQESNLREIEETRRRLSDAIESISEAFSLYDSDDRLVVCNSKYRSILYPGLAEEIEPGMTFESIVRRAIERGYIRDAGDDPEDWLARRMERHRNPGPPHTQQRGDGRWIMVSERRTEDGGTVALYSDITELKQREQELSEKSGALEQLSNQLAKYLSPQVYESIFTGRQEVKVTSRRRKLTVFFSDIAGFTETADRLESEELTELLNQYLTEMSKIALSHGATVDKYVGDAIVIFFGDPETKGVKEDALACARMAIDMRERMKELREQWRETGLEKPLECRMGINTGYCTVGNFGSEDRMDYTIIGGGVNLASRLETAATPGEILISYETFALISDEIECEERGKVEVKGIAYPVSTYQIVGPRDKADARTRRIHEDHGKLKLRIDLDEMSEAERERAEEVLRRALNQVSKNKD